MLHLSGFALRLLQTKDNPTTKTLSPAREVLQPVLFSATKLGAWPNLTTRLEARSQERWGENQSVQVSECRGGWSCLPFWLPPAQTCQLQPPGSKVRVL